MNRKYYYLALSLLLSIVLFSSCSKNDRPAQLNTDTNNIVFIQGETVRYFGIVNTGDEVMDFEISSSESYVEVFPSNGILGFNDLIKIEVKVNNNNLSYGIHYATLAVSSNGGMQTIEVQIINPLPSPAALWWDIDYLKIPSNADKDYITIRNDGEETLDYSLSASDSWLGFSQNSGQLQAGQEEVVWVEIDRSGLANNLYSGEVIISSNGGTGYVDIDMEVGVYSVSFYNPTYTDIDINVPGIGSQVIPVLGRVSYIFPDNPGSMMYQASTAGETVNNVTLGMFISWQENMNLSGENSPIFDLNISEDIFFLSAINYGSHDLDNWSINNGTDYQFDEDVLIPNDGFEYYFGYYDAFDDTKIYARIVGTDNDALWENGHEFDFPWAINQSILLESSLKSTVANPTRDFKSHKNGTGSLKMKNTTRTKQRVRNSKSLVNKR